MKYLRTHLDEESYLELVSEAAQKEGYKMAVLYEGQKIKGSHRIYAHDQFI